MNAAERVLRRCDRFQQRHAALAIPVAVVQKFGNDRAGAYATRIAYQGLFALFPLLLLLATVLGFLLEDHPDLRRDVIDSALRDFPVIGPELRDAATPLHGGGIALAVGIVGTLYGALGLGHAAEAALNTVRNVPRSQWPNFARRRLRSLAMVATIGVGIIGSAVAGAAVATIPWGHGPVAFLVSLLIDAVVFMSAFMVLTAARLTWRDVRLGALVAAVFWGTLKLAGEWYVNGVLRGAVDVYGFFATVIALLTWMYVAAQLVLLAAEVNVVVNERLWPRSLTQPPLTEADREVYRRLARTGILRPEYGVSLEFSDEADRDPLEHTSPDAAPTPSKDP
ncbi:MAG: YihY/virulence factor BrkB family protein [Acidimicrobiales bacterium]